MDSNPHHQRAAIAIFVREGKVVAIGTNVMAEDIAVTVIDYDGDRDTINCGYRNKPHTADVSRPELIPIRSEFFAQFAPKKH